MNETLNISPNSFWRGLLLMIVIALMVGLCTSCKSKKTVTQTTIENESKVEETESRETEKASERNLEKKTTTEEFGGELTGNIPLDLAELILNKKPVEFKAKGDGVELTVKVEEGKISYKAKATPTKRTTEEITENEEETESEKVETERKEEAETTIKEKSKEKVESGFKIPFYVWFIMSAGLLFIIYLILRRFRIL